MTAPRPTSLPAPPRTAQRARPPAPDVAPACRIPPHVVHAIAVLRGVGAAARPLDEGEVQALAVVFRAYGGMLHAELRALLARDAEVDDVLHDVFCALPSSIAHYRDGRFGRWLREAAVRAALARLRAEREATDATTARDPGAPADREAPAGHPEPAPDERARREVLARVMRTLREVMPYAIARGRDG